MILVALGSNMNGPWGNPRQTVERALRELDRDAVKLLRASRLLISKPFGVTHQAPFVNAVAEVVTHLPPEALLRRLHAIERAAGRRRLRRWGPRTLDLDLIDWHGVVRPAPLRPTLPHPGIAERIFVAKPVAEIAPRWRHPLSHLSAAEMLRRLSGVSEGGELQAAADIP
jgi:2-amino-4-hydroxy-6-hydroxymethyldihydropteridine diphosphokinase